MATDDFVAVIDGSTSKTPVRIVEGMSNGRLAMLLVSDYIRGMSANTTLEQCCEGMTELFLSIYRKHNIDLDRLEKAPQERMTASAAIFSRHYGQVWMVGDCQCIANGVLHENPKPYEKTLAEKRAAIINASGDKERFTSNDTARDAIIHDMLRYMLGQNKSYAVIDGFPIPQDKVKVVSVTKPEVILASDGYPFLENTLEASEQRLREQLLHDPLNINTYKATKGLKPGNVSFDDRAYVRFIV